MKWDSKANERLRKLLKAKTPYREIADIFGCSQSAVGGQVHRMGLSRRYSGGQRAPKFKAKPADPLEGLFLNGEPLQFAESGSSCARCGVRGDKHAEFGCGQFAEELRVRDR
jgi:hypothetical protein